MHHLFLGFLIEHQSQLSSIRFGNLSGANNNWKSKSVNGNFIYYMNLHKPFPSEIELLKADAILLSAHRWGDPGHGAL